MFTLFYSVLSIFISIVSVKSSVEALIISDTTTDAMLFGGVVYSILIVVILLLSRTNSKGAIVLVMLLMLLTGVFATPKEKKKKLLDDLSSCSADDKCDVKKLATLLFNYMQDEDVQTEKTCDSNGICLQGEKVTYLTQNDCFALKGISIKEAFCSQHSHVKCSGINRNEKIIYCLKHVETELGDSETNLIVRKVNDIKSEQQLSKRKSKIKSLLLAIRSRFTIGDIYDVIRLQRSLDYVTKQVPSSLVILGSAIIDGEFTVDEEREFYDEQDFDRTELLMKEILTRKDWSGISLKKIVFVTLIIFVVALTALIFGPKAFRNYIVLFVISSVLVLFLTLLW